MDRKELIEFEMSEDLEHLPDSRELKTYLRCFGELTDSVETKSNKLMLSKFADFFAELTREEQEKYIDMGRGCIKRARAVKDLLEFSYTLTVCFKRNNNQVN